MQPLISIIVPIYNVDKYLDRCLKSIQIQNYQNIEVIMVDDGSKDLSADIAQKYVETDHRFKLYRKLNGGLSSARNHGLQYATGDYVVFVDSDDFISSDCIDTLFEEFDKNTDVVIGDYVIYNENNGKAFKHSGAISNMVYSTEGEKDALLETLLTPGSLVMPVWKSMYRSSLIKGNEIVFVSEREVFAEDLYFNLIAYSTAGTVKVVQSIVYYHQIIGDSLSQKYRENYYEMSKQLNEMICSYLESSGRKHIRDRYMMKQGDRIVRSLFCLCKCSFSKALCNVKKILNDEYAKKILKDPSYKCSVKRYRLLYCLARYGRDFLVVVIAKTMYALEPLYRMNQRRERYEIEDKIIKIISDTGNYMK